MDDWTVKPWKTFAGKAIALKRAIGAESFPIITRDKHPQQWRDWYAYYGFRRMRSSQQMMREKNEKTVPTVSPFDFDAEFNPRYPTPEVPNDRAAERPNLTPEQRARHAALYPWLRGNSELAPATDNTEQAA